MVPERPPLSAVVLLAVAVALVANPLYLQGVDRGNQIVQVEAVSPAEGVADRSPAAREVDDLPATARAAARGVLADGSFRVDVDGPPLALQILGRDGRYLASHREVALYEPSVTVEGNTTSLSLAPADVEAVEDELGFTPPDSLRGNETVRRIAWLADRAPAVVHVGEFGRTWQPRMERAVAEGGLTVPNGNDESAFSPIGGEVGYVVSGATAYRATVETSDGTVALELRPVSNGTLVSQSRVAVVDADSLSPGTRSVVLEAVGSEDGSARFAHDAVDGDELERVADGLLRQEGAYYVVHRSHVDGFSLLPLVRSLLFAVGVVAGTAGAVLAYRARGA